jgi:hypothetical protein
MDEQPAGSIGPARFRPEDKVNTSSVKKTSIASLVERMLIAKTAKVQPLREHSGTLIRSDRTLQKGDDRARMIARVPAPVRWLGMLVEMGSSCV